jgi:hypothetical protein
MHHSKYGAIRKWFVAAESVGEFIGIRFGHLAPGASQPDWQFYPHKDYDGIGAFAEILRKRGAELCQLPQIKYYPAFSAVVSALKHWPRYFAPKKPLLWKPLERDGSSSDPLRPPEALAWHAFDENITQRMRLESRKNGFTVNTFLLKSLTEGLRPFLQDHHANVPWMVPVNMRGGVCQYRDSDNHSSYVALSLHPGEPAIEVHRRILMALSRGEHWGNWHGFKLGHWMTDRMRAYLASTGACLSQWSIGAFSNLGEWDPDGRITSRNAAGHWFFCPPTLRTQMIAAGSLTFQGRLTLTIQAHPDLTTSVAIAQEWMSNWVVEIHKSLDSEGGAPEPTALARTYGSLKRPSELEAYR